MTELIEADTEGTMLTEKQAWSYVAGVFSSEKHPIQIALFFGLNPKNDIIFGMCDIIQYLKGNDYITFETCQEMVSKINESLSKKYTNSRERRYLFDEDDKQSRVKYCQERIQEIKNEEVQKNV